MSSKKLIYSGLAFGLAVLVLTAVYPKLPKSQCLTQSDIALSIEHSRDGIPHSCTEAIRLVQIEQQRESDERLAQLRHQRQQLVQHAAPITYSEQ